MSGQSVGAQMGKLEGTGQVIGPDGKVKAEFTISTPVTEEQAKEIIEELNHGTDTLTGS